jgi:hypothetical protein
MIPPREIPENGPFPALAAKLNEIIRFVVSLTPRPSIHHEVDHLTTGVTIRPRATTQVANEPDDLTWL